MRPVEDLERELARVTAERDALARHVERLIAPATVREAQTVQECFPEEHLEVAYMATVLDEFIAERQRKAQFAAFDDPQLPLDP